MPTKDAERRKQNNAKYYAKNKDRHKQRVKEYKQKVADYIKSVKESSPCLDCGEYYPYYVMVFDHLKDKDGDISRAGNVYGWSIKRVQEEINKCELVCANCHRTRTHAYGS